MVRLVAALAGLARALPATASAFGKTDQPVRMSDGVRLATTYYVPDGAPPAGGWPAVMLLHGLGGSRNAGMPFGMSLNSLAETQLAPQGYAPLSVRRAALGATRRRSGPAHAPAPDEADHALTLLTPESM